MHRKVAKKYMTRALSDHLQAATTDARLDLSKLEEFTSRAKALIDDSDAKEHIYKEAGDVIFIFQTTLEQLRDKMNVISYISDNLSMEASSRELPPAFRKELDEALEGNDKTAKITTRKQLEDVAANMTDAERRMVDDVLKASYQSVKANTEIGDMQGNPWYVDEIPEALEDEEVGAWTGVPKPSPRDYTNFKLNYSVPNTDGATR